MEHREALPPMPSHGFEMPRRLHALLDRLDLRFLAAGGASLVYKIGDSNQLIKINHQYPARTIATAHDLGLSFGEAETLLAPARRERERKMLERRDKFIQ